MTEIENLLQKTSRTFALAIPLLPEPTRNQVGVAYLLFRIADTFEDATLWSPGQRIEALNRFVGLLDQDPAAAEALAGDCALRPPVQHAGYQELLAKMPLVLRDFGSLAPGARAPIRRQVGRSVEGMDEFVRRSDSSGRLELTTVDELRDYCYCVAGIVGEMLTELYLLDRPALIAGAEDLRNRAADFGEGLQLVNILKDAHRDAEDGRIFLPRGAALRELLDLAASDLVAAAEYVQILRRAGAEPGLIAFNALISNLAVANLEILAERGLGAKLSRPEVARIGADVMQELRLGDCRLAVSSAD
jgi:farnesyl-diphosphate farnesyltransferase